MRVERLAQSPASARVLVVDDEPQILRALRVVLRDEGFEVVPAETGAEALDRAAVRPPQAAIVDLMLPDMDGIELTRRLREWSEMPILVLSAVGEEEQKVLALGAGADDYVTKPFGSRELVARLRAALRRGGRAEEQPAIVAGRARDRPGGARGATARRGRAPDADRVRAAARAGAQSRAVDDTPRAAGRGVGAASTSEDVQTLRTHIARLRAKVEPDGRGALHRHRPRRRLPLFRIAAFRHAPGAIVTQSLCPVRESSCGRDARRRIVVAMDAVAIALAIVVFALLLWMVKGIEKI